MTEPFVLRWEDLSLYEQLAFQPNREEIIASLTDEELYDFNWDWTIHGRPKQLAPPGDWDTWMLRAGRGFGKTRSGVGWVQTRAMQEQRWIALIARNPGEARDYMIQGPGGFLDKAGENVRPEDRPTFEISKKRLVWPNGSWATIYSDEEPDQLRGYSGDTAWIDELGKFHNPELIWDNLQFGMREASTDQPRRMLTLTPKVIGRANALIRSIEHMPTTVTTRGTSYENAANLSPKYYAGLQVYEGTKTGKEEIYGELIDPEEAGVIKRSMFKLWPHNKPLPLFETVIVSLDTAFTEKTRDKDSFDPDPTACSTWGLFKYEHNGVYKAGVLLVDCWAERLGFPALLKRAAKEMRQRYGTPDQPTIRPLYGTAHHTLSQGKSPDLLIIEDKGSGISLRQSLAREGIFSFPYNPGRADKLARLHAISHVVEQGICWLPESETREGRPKTWVEPFLAQVCTFAGEGSVKHDDFVDTFTQAIRVMLDKHLLRVTPEPTTNDEHALPTDADSPYGRPYIRNNAYAT